MTPKFPDWKDSEAQAETHKQKPRGGGQCQGMRS